MAQQSVGLLHSRSARAWIALALLALGVPRTAHTQIAVVVNPSNSIEELSLDNLRRLFLGQAKTFPTGAHARLGMHSPSAPAFDRAALRLQPEIVRSRWMAMIFRGEATSIPTELTSPDDVKKFVRDHADAIAFLPLSNVDGSVKVLAVAGRRPNDAGYVIR
jgi:hypothetical protein